jgi:hypothetical protein
MADILTNPHFVVGIFLAAVALSANLFTFLLARIRERAIGRTEGIRTAFRTIAEDLEGEDHENFFAVAEAKLRFQLEEELRKRLELVFGPWGQLAFFWFWAAEGFMFSLLMSTSITALCWLLCWLAQSVLNA